MYKKYIKHIIDVLFSIVGLMVLFIPMCIIAIVIKIDSKGPVIFKQMRIGKGEKPFAVYKFRTMHVNSYERGKLVNRSDDPRITKVGAVLRRTSLDELPQLFNIINGTMAIVGPRPILDWEFDGYRDDARYRLRHSVLPGLFCSVDIDLRASADRNTQFEMDAEYAENITFLNDMILCIKIIRTVLSGKNVYKEEVDVERK